MRPSIIFLLTSLLFTFSTISAQELIHAVSSCAYGSSSEAGQYYSFESDSDAEKIMTRILRAAPGYNRNNHPFELRAGGRVSVAEVITTRNEKKIILYSQHLLNELNSNTETNWAAVSILAHELGHIVYDHKYKKHDRQHNHKNELAADRYSGIVLARLGADEKDTRIALKTAGNSRATDSHPHPEDRLAAITNGWTKGKNGRTQSIPDRRTTQFSPPSYSTTMANAKRKPAPKLQISDVRTDLNAFQNGVSGIRLYANFSQAQLSGKKINVVAYFNFRSGAPLKDFNGKYKTKGGNVSATASVTPKYQNSKYSDIEIFIPDDELHLSASQDHKLEIKLQLHCNGSKSKTYHVTSFQFKTK